MVCCFFYSRAARRVGARRRKEYPEHEKRETGGETVGCRRIKEKVDEGTEKDVKWEQRDER